MTLPRIIIPCRASLKAVPPSIREGALAIGASKVQSVTHHVLPLAIPGNVIWYYYWLSTSLRRDGSFAFNWNGCLYR